MSLRLQSAIDGARRSASKVGPLHSLWDLIMDAEAHQKGEQTLGLWPSDSQAREELMIDKLEKATNGV